MGLYLGLGQLAPHLGHFNRSERIGRRMNEVIEVQRVVQYSDELGQASPGEFVKIIRRMAAEIKESDPALADYQVYDAGFKREGEEVVLCIYFKRPV